MTFKYKTKEKLTKENISRTVSDYDLLTYYVNEFKGYDKTIPSNIRFGNSDSVASLRFTYRKGKALISDFGSLNVGMDVFKYLQIYLQYPDDIKGFLSLLERIRRDFKLQLEPYINSVEKVAQMPQKPPIIHDKIFSESTSWDIRYRSREFGEWQVDYEFWIDQYGIQFDTLREFNVKALESFMLIQGEKRITYLASEKNPRYCYVPHPSLGIHGWKRKVYSPWAEKEQKWFNSLPMNTHLALNLLPEKGDILVIETSLKDTMTNYQIFKNKNDETTSFIDLFAESVFLSKSLLDNLNRRFDTIIYHADNDATGIRQAIKFKEEFGIPYFVNPPQKALKDSSDMRKAWGEDLTYNFLKENTWNRF